MTDEKIKVTEDDRLRFYRSIISYGYMDIDAAILTAKEVGKDPEWIGDRILELSEDMGTRIENIDPVAEVYESILQEARGEIEEETEYDLCNDVKARIGIYTAGNYCCTQYDYSEDAIEELEVILASKDVDIYSLSQTTQWFLKEIGIPRK